MDAELSLPDILKVLIRHEVVSDSGIPKTPARRAEFIQPGVSTLGGRCPKDPQAPQGRQVLPRERYAAVCRPSGAVGRGGGPVLGLTPQAG